MRINKIRQLIYALIFMVVFSAQPTGAAADLNYFEFSPDTSKTINVAAFSAVYQEFKPYNDFLNGVDIWVDNVGTRGTVNFTLLNQNDSVIVSKAIIIPNIPIKWGGERLRISFDPVLVSSTSTYKIKISSFLPKFRIYYLSKTDFLEHNAPFDYSSLIGNAYLGNAVQDFIFKFALYENGDILPPKIYNLSFTAISNDRMRVDINANEPVDMRIDYQTIHNLAQINDRRSTSYTNNYNFCVELKSKCSLMFNVIPNMTYNYQLYVSDFWGNQTQISGLFESSKTGVFQIFPTASIYNGDTIAISIINPRVVSVTPFSAKIAWSTNIPAVSRGLISLNQEWNQIITRMGDNTFKMDHLLDTGNVLSPNTRYYALINSDSFSTALIGETLNFITQSINQDINQKIQQQNNLLIPLNQNIEQFIDAEESLPPLIIRVRRESERNGATAIIKWDKLSSEIAIGGYRIDIFDNNNNLIRQVMVSAEDDRISVEGLLQGNYRVVVYAHNNQIFEKIGKETKFSILPEEPVLDKLNFNVLKFALAGFGFLIFGAAFILKIIKRRDLKIKN